MTKERRCAQSGALKIGLSFPKGIRSRPGYALCVHTRATAVFCHSRRESIRAQRTLTYVLLNTRISAAQGYVATVEGFGFRNKKTAKPKRDVDIEIYFVALVS